MTTDEILPTTVRALELLAESHAAHVACDHVGALTKYDQAAKECGADVVLALTGGMRIGEIPTPGTDDWDAYLAHQRDRLHTNTENGD